MPTKKTGSGSTTSSPKRTAASAALKEQAIRRRDTLERSAYQYENGLTSKGAEPGRYSKKADALGAYRKEYERTIANGAAQQVYGRKTGDYSASPSTVKKLLGKKK